MAVVATVPVIERHGINQILKPFLADLTNLVTEGVEVVINGCQRTFKGALLAFLADNLASNFLGGFKMSFSFSFRSCRTSLVTNPNLSSSFVSNFKLRSKEEHEKLIQGPLRVHAHSNVECH